MFYKFRKNILPLIAISTLLSACSAPSGTVHVMDHAANSTLKKPVDLIHNEEDLIFHREDKNTPSDVFAIYLTDTYLRYLPDMWGMSEIVVIAEFEEAVTGDPEKDRVVKVLGPYENIADMSRAPLLNKLLYGPKEIESDVLSMRLRIYEFDGDENEKHASLLDFVSASGEALGISNPVTAAQMQVAKEMAKALIKANDNDLILDMDMDFVAGVEGRQLNGGEGGIIVPLQAGGVVFVKRESCRVGTCYLYFTEHDDKGNPVALVADAAMALPTALVRGLTDAPDRGSLLKIEEDKTRLKAIESFEGKTWARLSVIKGGSSARWKERKTLMELEREFASSVTTAARLDSTQIEALEGSVKKAKDKLEEIEAQQGMAVQLVESKNLKIVDGSYYIRPVYDDNNKASFSFCTKLQQGVTVEEGAVLLYAGAKFNGTTTLAKEPTPVDYNCSQTDLSEPAEFAKTDAISILSTQETVQKTDLFRVTVLSKDFIESTTPTAEYLCSGEQKYTLRVDSKYPELVTSAKQKGEGLEIERGKDYVLIKGLQAEASGAVNGAKKPVGSVQLSTAFKDLSKEVDLDVLLDCPTSPEGNTASE